MRDFQTVGVNKRTQSCLPFSFVSNPQIIQAMNPAGPSQTSSVKVAGGDVPEVGSKNVGGGGGGGGEELICPASRKMPGWIS
jgi:hypothetical protein